MASKPPISHFLVVARDRRLDECDRYFGPTTSTCAYMEELIKFVSIDDFQLKWRFAEDETNWTVLPPNDLTFFKPLTEDSALRLWSTYVSTSAQHLMEIALRSVPPDRNQFGKLVLVIDDNWSSDEEHDRVAEILNNHVGVAASSIVYFFWDASCAVETTWNILLRYWSDFCYPSDDSNVAVILDTNIIIYYIEGAVWLSSRADPDPPK